MLPAAFRRRYMNAVGATEAPTPRATNASAVIGLTAYRRASNALANQFDDCGRVSVRERTPPLPPPLQGGRRLCYSPALARQSGT